MAIPILTLLRPKQWIKNGLVLAPLFFAGLFSDVPAWQVSMVGLLSFISISCVVYIINDIRDRGEDAIHPVKRLRPLASGKVTVMQAVLVACLFMALAVLCLTMLPAGCIWVAIVYLASNVVYTIWLKHVAIVDIFFIAFCYVLRVLMGGYALEVHISPWIILSTFLLALFLACGKRFHEMSLPEYAASKKNLKHYSRDLLDRMLAISGCSALMAYSIYAAEVAERIHRMEMIYTVGFVAFGLFRYLQMLYVYGKGGEPENIFFKDKLQQANVGLWLFTTLWVMFS